MFTFLSVCLHFISCLAFLCQRPGINIRTINARQQGNMLVWALSPCRCFTLPVFFLVRLEAAVSKCCPLVRNHSGGMNGWVQASFSHSWPVLRSFWMGISWSALMAPSLRMALIGSATTLPCIPFSLPISARRIALIWPLRKVSLPSLCGLG